MKLPRVMTILDYLFPNFTCLACRDELREAEQAHICNDCFGKIQRAKYPTNKAKNVLKLGKNDSGKDVKIWLDRVSAPFVYSSCSPISKMIRGLKYYSDGQVAEALAPYMIPCLNILDYDMIIPIPLAKSRQRERGFNQATKIAREVLNRSSISANIYEGIVIKTKSTTPQVDMSTEQRLQNQADAYSINQEKLPYIKGKRILIIDDVITSGATINEVARALRKAGAKCVDALAIARVGHQQAKES